MNNYGDTISSEVNRMTQQQFVHEFKSYPKAKRSVVIRQLLRIFEDDLEDNTQNGGELSIEERVAIVESLAGSLKMENPPMTKEETREMYYEHLSEKHK